MQQRTEHRTLLHFSTTPFETFGL